jgi:RNA polymerase sigma-70 factor, ECF subfamily
LSREDELRLIEQVQSGDADSFDALVELYRDKGYNLAYQWTNNQEDALDVLQDAFIKMYKVIPKWKPESSLFTWLYRVIINRAIDLQRFKKKTALTSTSAGAEEGSEEMEFQASDISRPDRQAESRELSDWIYKEVMTLPPKQKEVFILRNYQGMALKEIAKICRCPIGTIKANLFQAVQKLRSQLSEFKKGDRKDG